MTTNQDKLQKLYEDYSRELPNKIKKIEEQWQALQPNMNKQGLKDFHRAVHSLCGSLATYEYEALHQVMRDLELYLLQLIEHHKLNPNQISEIYRLIGQINETLKKEKPSIVNPIIHLESKVESKLIIYINSESETFENTLKKNLEDIGYTLIFCATVDECYNYIQTRVPVVLIIDEHHLNDKQLQNTVQFAKRRNIVLFCIAKHGDIQTRLKCIRAGISIFLHHPIDVSYLTNRLIQLSSIMAKEYYRILILEDTKILAEHYSLVLEEAGMKTRICTDPLKLIQELQEFNPNLLLLDLFLPNCTGDELARIVRQDDRYAGLPIIFISTETDRYKQLRILNNSGGDDFLTKPVLPQNLVAAIKSRAQRSATLVSYIEQDSLTQLLNHSYILRQLEIECLRAHRQHAMFSVAMIDLDYFKKINDQYGHLVGDMVLKKIALLLSEIIRRTDYIGRYGGEEFVVILPDTSLKDAINLLTKIRETISIYPFETNGETFYVTLSVGISSYPKYSSMNRLIAAADQALYKAKTNGRNRIETC